MNRQILDPDSFGITNQTYRKWRILLKAALLDQRGWKSDLSGLPITLSTGCHLHEALIPRARVPSGIWWHYKIFHEYNCMLLLPHEHTPQPPPIDIVKEVLTNLYSYATITQWIDSLPFKVPYRI